MHRPQATLIFSHAKLDDTRTLGGIEGREGGGNEEDSYNSSIYTFADLTAKEIEREGRRAYLFPITHPSLSLSPHI